MCSASDGAGSIRFPASWTGLIGLKTTRGLLPLPRGLDESLMSGASEGALTKSVRDCALIYEQLAVHRYWGNSFMPPPLMPPLLEESREHLERFASATVMQPGEVNQTLRTRCNK